MKKKYFFGIIGLLAICILTPTVLVFAKSGPILYDVMIKKAELADTFNGVTELTSGLTELTPWWIDSVDTENINNDGSGVTVAVLDTGLLTLAPFLFSQANIRYDLGIGFTHEVNADGTDLLDPLIVRDFWTNEFGSGHGTHVTSTIVGFNYNNMYWIKGVAPAVEIIPVLVLDAWSYDGELLFTGGTNEMIAAGIDYVSYLVETGEVDGTVIINMSLGGPNPSDLIKAAIDYAMDLGIIFVVSAGNEGEAGMGYPGAYDEVISAAMGGYSGYWDNSWINDIPEDFFTPDAYGNNHILFLDDYSSRPNNKLHQQPKLLDVCAPGVAIVGPYKSYGYGTGWGYYYLWGTSMAAPHVSGIAALVAQEVPDLTPYEMHKILKNAAHGNPLPADGTLANNPWGMQYYEWTGKDYGAGWLQADQAVFVASAMNMGLM